MVNYIGGAAFQAKMTAKLAALNNETVPSVSNDGDMSTWSMDEKMAAQDFWDRWNVDNKIECDCDDQLCRRARMHAGQIVPF